MGQLLLTTLEHLYLTRRPFGFTRTISVLRVIVDHVSVNFLYTKLKTPNQQPLAFWWCCVSEKMIVTLYTINISVHNNNYNKNNCFMALGAGLPGEPVPEETFTHSHLSWSSSILYQLPPSTTIHGILPVLFVPDNLFAQPLSKSSLVYLLVCHTPHISSSSDFFSQHML